MRNRSGYIAVTTSIILSFLILLISTSLGFGTWFSRIGSLNFSFKSISYFLAESCLDVARLKLAQSDSYAGNENVTVGTYQCTIKPITSPSGQKVITTQAKVNGATTNLKLTITYPQFQIVSLEEI
ncbi:MAG: hypothetical protein HYW37_00760 [Candidatus Colwellbacteria bacterium]|nr:hypothetical protein [Candidatus Colwellbacteria bacterium]